MIRLILDGGDLLGGLCGVLGAAGRQVTVLAQALPGVPDLTKAASEPGTDPDSLLTYVRPGLIPYALLILLVTLVLTRLLTRGLERVAERFADKRLLINQAGSFLRFGLYLVGGAGAVFTVVPPSPPVLLAVGGASAVAFGFAVKDLVASVIAGLIILVDKPFQVGDRVTFEGHYGEIRHIGLRSVRLMTLDDTLITMPNSRFLTENVASGNAGAIEMMVQMDFYIGIDQDFARARRLVQEALTTSRYVHLKHTWSVNVNEVVHESYFAIRLRAKAYVLDVRFEKAFESDVTERVLSAFRDAGIAPPAVLHRNVTPPTLAPT